MEEYGSPCVLCGFDTEEALQHLFLQCPFAGRLFIFVLLFHMIHYRHFTVSRTQLNVSFFMDVIITMCWCIWMMRNDKIFRDIQPIVQRCKSRKEESPGHHG